MKNNEKKNWLQHVSLFSTYFGCKENVVLFRPRPNMFPSTNPFTHVLAGVYWHLHALVFAGEELACEGTPQVFWN